MGIVKVTRKVERMNVDMRRGSIISMAGAAGVATLSFILMNKDRRGMVKNKWNEVRDAFKKEDTSLPIEEAGDPGKDNLQNANMVAEGSQFGVEYYNKVRET